MLRKLRSRLTYANVMSSIAVFIVLGGSAYAAVKLPKNSVGAKQIKKGAVTRSKLANGAVNGSKVAAGSLTGKFGEAVRAFALELVRAELVHNVTSDAHDAVRRPPSVLAELEQAGLEPLAA